MKKVSREKTVWTLFVTRSFYNRAFAWMLMLLVTARFKRTENLISVCEGLTLLPPSSLVNARNYGLPPNSAEASTESVREIIRSDQNGYYKTSSTLISYSQSSILLSLTDASRKNENINEKLEGDGTVISKIQPQNQITPDRINDDNQKIETTPDQDLSKLLAANDKILLRDEVVRVIDANTVQLSKNGFVTMAAIQSPSSYNNNNNSCMSTYPSTKLKQLLPLNTKVQIIKWTDEENNNGKKRSLIFTTRYNKDKTNQLLFVNSELVKAGMAKPSIRGQAKAEQLIPGVTQMIQDLNQQAKSRKVGIYQTCDAGVTSTSTNMPPLPSEKINIGMEKSSFDLDSQFEPMENSVETQWGDDGGKQILVPRMKENIFSPSNPPPNPGDSKQCYDFESFEDALQWYERYEQYYGDVANLDRDGDGIPCSGLPHTKNSERYRVKKKYNNNPHPVKTITRTQ